jgi:hypothetical protein
VRDRFNKLASLSELDGLLNEVWKSPYFEDENVLER